MSYLTTIPNATDFLAISQKQLLANYQAIFNTFSKNHVVLNSVTNTIGHHTAFTMPRQASDPTTLANQIAFYNKFDANTVPQLFFRPPSNQTPIQMTNSNYSVLDSPTTFRVSTFLPGPMTLYLGFIRNATMNQLVTLTPSTNLVYVGLTTVLTAKPATTIVPVYAVPTDITGNTFKIAFPTSISDPIIYYMAIGLT